MSSHKAGQPRVLSYMGAAVISVILFVVTLLHTYRFFRTRTWFFIPLVVEGSFPR